MAEIKNTFIKSKMNKDLDARIVPNGEYRDALNVEISTSEGESVGALQTILGNRLYFEEETYNTCIGAYADQINNRIFYFVTDYIDSSVDGLSNAAPPTAYCAIVSYDVLANIKTVLVSGHFLNFSARSPIIGVNLLENLLFWTDNRNQPRKINILNAFSSPAAQPESGRYPASTTEQPYYSTEDQISVAKYYPWKPISLMNINEVSAGTTPDASTMTNPSEQYYPGTLSQKPDYDSAWPGDPDFLSDKFIRLSYRLKFEDNEYSLIAPFTQPCFIPKQFGYFLDDDETQAYKSTIVDFFENNVTQILANIEFETNRPDNDLKVKSVDILYKESDQVQIKVIETIDIDEVISNMQANGTAGGNNKVFTYKYISTAPYKGLIEEETSRVFDKVPVRALAQEVSGNRVIYGNYYTTYSPVKQIDYNVMFGDKSFLIGNSQKEYPTHTIKQNRNYQVGFVLADRYGRQSSVILSSNDEANAAGGINYGGSTIYVPYRPITGGANALNWPGYALRVLLNEIIPNTGQVNVQNYPGLYKDYNAGVDALIIDDSGSGYLGAGVTYTTTGGSGTGLVVTADASGGQSIRNVEILSPGSGYKNGEIVTVVGGNNDATLIITVNDPNPLGWYSYKIVVRQPEQDYYNCYLPGILNGYPANYINSKGDPEYDYEQNKTANIVLINDNINKIPRDLEEVGPDQKQYRSAVKLYGRVVPVDVAPVGDNYNTQYQPSLVGDSVVSISTLADVNYNGTTLGDKVSGGTSEYSLNYPEFYSSNTNPLIARISTITPIGKKNRAAQSDPALNNYAYDLGVYETDPFESQLDIYWETTSSGLIKDLNQAVVNGGYAGAVATTGFSFSLSEASPPGSTAFDGSIFAVDSLANVIYQNITFELISVFNAAGSNLNSLFDLVTTGSGTIGDPLGFNINTSPANPPAFFYYGSEAINRIYNFTVKCTVTSGGITYVNYVNLNNCKLTNVSPDFVTILPPPFGLPPTPKTDCGLISAVVDSTSTDDLNSPIYTFYAVNGSYYLGGVYRDEITFNLSFGSERFYLETRPNEPGVVDLYVKRDAAVTGGTVPVTVTAIDSGGLRNSCTINVEVIQQAVPEIEILGEQCLVAERTTSDRAAVRWGVRFKNLNVSTSYKARLRLVNNAGQTFAGALNGFTQDNINSITNYFELPGNGENTGSSTQCQIYDFSTNLTETFKDQAADAWYDLQTYPGNIQIPKYHNISVQILLYLQSAPNNVIAQLNTNLNVSIAYTLPSYDTCPINGTCFP